MTVANAVLVYEESGVVGHRFCPEAEARECLAAAAADFGGGSMFAAEGVEAELTYRVSPDLRSMVEDAKAKLRKEVKMRDAMDRRGIPRDRELRNAIVEVCHECAA